MKQQRKVPGEQPSPHITVARGSKGQIASLRINGRNFTRKKGDWDSYNQAVEWWTRVSTGRIAGIPVRDLPEDAGLMLDAGVTDHLRVGLISIHKGELLLECLWTMYFEDDGKYLSMATNVDRFCADLRTKTIDGVTVELRGRFEAHQELGVRFNLFFERNVRTFGDAMATGVSLVKKYGLLP